MPHPCGGIPWAASAAAYPKAAQGEAHRKRSAFLSERVDLLSCPCKNSTAPIYCRNLQRRRHSDVLFCIVLMDYSANEGGFNRDQIVLARDALLHRHCPLGGMVPRYSRLQ